VSLAYYVYYRVEPRREADARQRVQSVLAQVRRDCGVAGRVLRKRDEPNLWMEVYEAVEEHLVFEAALDRAAAATRIAEVLAAGSARKVECFRE
jgi:hypothetical protein